MADLFPDRLEPATGVSPLEQKESFRDLGPRQRRRPPQPVSPRETEAEVEAESSETAGEPPHQLDRMA